MEILVFLKFFVVMFFSIALTKLDILDTLSDIKVGVAYAVDDKPLDSFPGEIYYLDLQECFFFFSAFLSSPSHVIWHWFSTAANMDVLTKVVVTYETLPGWCCSTEGARNFSDLPPQAQAYIRFIENFLHVPGKTLCMCNALSTKTLIYRT